jgi:thiol-disulfide isomerase/thioredoxin
MKRLSIVILLISSLILSSCSKKIENPQSQNQSSQQTQQQVGEAQNTEQQADEKIKAPDFELPNLKGENVRLSSLQGKTIVLNFFTTWCKFCKVEMPGFIEVSKEYKDKNVEFLFIDVQEDKETVEKFLKERNYDNINVVLDVLGEVAAEYGVRGYPTTLILDKEGNVAISHVGLMEKEILKDALEEVIAQK